MFYATTVHLATVCGYKILHFGANPQKYHMQKIVTLRYL